MTCLFFLLAAVCAVITPERSLYLPQSVRTCHYQMTTLTTE